MRVGYNSRKIGLWVFSAFAFILIVGLLSLVFDSDKGANKKDGRANTENAADSSNANKSRDKSRNDADKESDGESGDAGEISPDAEGDEHAHLSETYGGELFAELPYQTANWEVSGQVDNDYVAHFRVYVTGAILNRPDQVQQYEEDLAKYKAEALDWFRKKGYDTARLDISFQPE